MLRPGQTRAWNASGDASTRSAAPGSQPGTLRLCETCGHCLTRLLAPGSLVTPKPARPRPDKSSRTTAQYRLRLSCRLLKTKAFEGSPDAQQSSRACGWRSRAVDEYRSRCIERAALLQARFWTVGTMEEERAATVPDSAREPGERKRHSRRASAIQRCNQKQCRLRNCALYPTFRIRRTHN